MEGIGIAACCERQAGPKVATRHLQHQQFSCLCHFPPSLCYLPPLKNRTICKHGCIFAQHSQVCIINLLCVLIHVLIIARESSVRITSRYAACTGICPFVDSLVAFSDDAITYLHTRINELSLEAPKYYCFYYI
jgi:hypothetical protein